MRKSGLATLKTAAIGAMLLLSACSSRDAVLDEKIQQAEQAAQRAEAAQSRAEAAAAKAVTFASHAGISDEHAADPPSPAEKNMEKASQDPNSPYYDNKTG